MSTRQSLVELTANKLRLIQSELADASEDERRRHLDQAVTEALKERPVHEHPAFLSELSEHFPTWDIRRQPEPAPLERRPVELDSWEFLLKHLLRVAKGLEAREREIISARLGESGMCPETPSEWPQEAEKDLRAVLDVPDERPLVPERVLRLAAFMIEFVSKVESAAWGSWKRLAPDSSIRPKGNLKPTLAAFLEGKDELGGHHISPQIDDLRELIAAFMNALARSPEHIAQKYMDELSPLSIRELVEPELGIMHAGPPRFWKKYEEIAWGPDFDGVARKVIEPLVRKDIEDLLRGRGRGG